MQHLNKLGLRITGDFQRVDAHAVQIARGIPAAVIGDACNRLQGLSGGFLHYGRTKTFAGPALTVRVRPGDNLFLAKAIDLAQPGDVVVVDAGGGLNVAMVGGMMTKYAVFRRIEALVVDGAVRDVQELAATDLAVVARGISPNGPFKTGPGEIGYPIACGGISIASGDLVVGDHDGVVVVPRESVAQVLAVAQEKLRMEQSWEVQIAQGNWDRGWIDQALAKLS